MGTGIQRKRSRAKGAARGKAKVPYIFTYPARPRDKAKGPVEVQQKPKQKPVKKKPTKKVKKAKEVEVERAPCARCGREVVEVDYHCAGCDRVVCDVCDIRSPWGGHRLEAHWEEEE